MREKDPTRLRYLGALWQVDQACGVVIRQMQRLGRLERTVVVVSTDNGGAMATGDYNGRRCSALAFPRLAAPHLQSSLARTLSQARAIGHSEATRRRCTREACADAHLCGPVRTQCWRVVSHSTHTGWSVVSHSTHTGVHR